MLGTTRARRLHRLGAVAGLVGALALAGCYSDEGSNGYRSAVAVDVNAGGTVVVQATNAGQTSRTFAVSTDDTWTPVGPAGPTVETTPIAVSDAGVVLGNTYDLTANVDTPFLWDAVQGYRTLQSVTGVALPHPADMADDGSVVGSNGSSGRLWRPGSAVVDLAPLHPGGSVAVAAVNDQGQVVGASDGQAVLWEAPAYVPVVLDGAAAAVDINDAGTAIGLHVRWSADDHEATVVDGSLAAIGDDGTVVGTIDGEPVIWDADTLEPHHPGSPADDGTGDVAAIDGQHVVGSAFGPGSGSDRHLIRYSRP